ncbi:MAG: hypothetical protein R8G33_08575 [Gammaproteobacteria bacterium]|nr:hypothetical protein [Gammaproteobacteria bacterium]
MMISTVDQVKNDSSVSVLLLRLQKKEILVPKAMVADVLSWKDNFYSPAITNRAKWKLGEYLWDEWKIPLVCFEGLIDANFQREEIIKRKIVVIRSFQKGFENDHYAIECRGFPKPLILSEESLGNLHVEDNQGWIAHSISIGSRVLDVPDFSTLQSAVWSMDESLHPEISRSA